MKTLLTICTLFFMAAAVPAQSVTSGQAANNAITGESWLHHLHRSLDETSMGRTWRLGPAQAPSQQSVSPENHVADSQIVTLHGSDLYRLNCQGCHGATGQGAPPEIASIINPVRSISPQLVARHMKDVGMEMNPRELSQMVNQSTVSLLKRLHEGGQDMPSFHHLSNIEVRALIAYLEQLAGVPGFEKQQVMLQEPPLRVGELIVRSTCHVCHDAAGENPSATEIMQGAIPPLNMLPARVTEPQLVEKVTAGAPVIMGVTSSAYRGRMPVFDYLSPAEAADVYAYLKSYPPVQSTALAQADAASFVTDGFPRSNSASSSLVPHSLPSASMPGQTSMFLAFVTVSGAFTMLALALGAGITVHEFRRLSGKTTTAAAKPHDTSLAVSADSIVEELSASNVASAPSVSKQLWLEERKIS